MTDRRRLLKTTSASPRTSKAVNADPMDVIFPLNLVYATGEPRVNASVLTLPRVRKRAMIVLDASAVAGTPGTLGASKGLRDRVALAP